MMAQMAIAIAMNRADQPKCFANSVPPPPPSATPADLQAHMTLLARPRSSSGRTSTASASDATSCNAANVL
jgi:hypothetical protein